MSALRGRRCGGVICENAFKRQFNAVKRSVVECAVDYISNSFSHPGSDCDTRLVLISKQWVLSVWTWKKELQSAGLNVQMWCREFRIIPSWCARLKCYVWKVICILAGWTRSAWNREALVIKLIVVNDVIKRRETEDKVKSLWAKLQQQ